jgi:hypothetical protein
MLGDGTISVATLGVGLPLASRGMSSLFYSCVGVWTVIFATPVLVFQRHFLFPMIVFDLFGLFLSASMREASRLSVSAHRRRDACRQLVGVV